MLILNHEQYNMVYEGNVEGNFADKMNLMYTSDIIDVLAVFYIEYYSERNTYIKHLIKLELCLICSMVVI